MGNAAPTYKRPVVRVPSQRSNSTGALKRGRAAFAHALRRLLGQRVTAPAADELGGRQASGGGQPPFAGAETEDGTLLELQEALRELDADLVRLRALRGDMRRRYGVLLPRFADQLLSESERTAVSAERLCRRSQQLARRLEGR